MSGILDKIVINGRFATQRITGVQRYAREIVSRWERDAVEVVSPAARAAGMRGQAWEQLALPRRLRGRSLWSPCNTGPLSVRRQVVTVHDVAFCDVPHCYPGRAAAWYRWLIPRLVRRAHRVITVSRFSKERILAHCHCRPDDVVVIHGAVDQRFHEVTAETISQVRERRSLPERYVVAVGTLEPRKNLPRIVAAWRRIGPLHPDVRLVLVGMTPDHCTAEMDRLVGDDPSIQRAGYVPDEDLPAVYGGAELAVYASIYEGFGLPVLEAMASGTPVVCSNNTSLPEVAGDAAILVDPFSVDDVAAGIDRGLSQPALREELREAGKRRARAFNWDRVARETWQLLEQAEQED
jgi:glycosyltransferase involved in cell wall biosynthesis